jgi:hypothetical protein
MPSGRFFPYLGIHLGTATSFATFNEQTLNASGSGPYLGQLGMVVEESNKVYRLVQFDNGSGDVASTVGGAAHWKTRASYIVTSDQTDAEASLNSVAGGFLKAGVTDQYYCFVQLGGVQAVVVNTTVSSGDALIATTTDLTLVATTTNTKGNQLTYAIAYSTNSTTSANAYWVLGNLL